MSGAQIGVNKLLHCNPMLLTFYHLKMTSSRSTMKMLGGITLEIFPFVRYCKKLYKRPKTTLKTYLNGNDSVHAIIGADGSKSFIRNHFKISDRVKSLNSDDWAIGIEFQKDVPDEVQIHQLHNIGVTLSNTRFLMNSYKSGKAVFLIGDAAFTAHFWPGRGMNSGIKAAVALARRLFWGTDRFDGTWKERNLFLFFIFMEALRYREQELRSDAMMSSQTMANILETVKTVENGSNLDEELKEKILRWANTIARRRDEKMDWDDILPKLQKYLSDIFASIDTPTKRILSASKDWPVENMGGEEINPDKIMCEDPLRGKNLLL